MNQTEKKIIPPYVSYRTLQNFLDRLKAVGIPSRIDSSVMSSLSGTAQSQIQGALKYLQLMSEKGIPSEQLQRLVSSEGAEKQKILREILTKAYPFLFKEGVHLEKITFNQIQEIFNNEGATGGTTQKCIAFFMRIAKEAAIKISPHIKIKSRVGRPKGRKTSFTEKHNNDISETGTEIKQTVGIGWQQLLLSKFPSFDPAWPDDVKTKWFDGFKELMEQFKKTEDEEEEGN